MSARVGGGIKSKDLIDALWKSGKQTVYGACECTGAGAPMLGGGHRFLQGQYGLMADNSISLGLCLPMNGYYGLWDGERRLVLGVARSWS